MDEQVHMAPRRAEQQPAMPSDALLRADSGFDSSFILPSVEIVPAVMAMVSRR
jgi:hypothetical protein